VVNKYRSRFERTLALSLQKAKVPFTYETKSYPVQLKVARVVCTECGSRDIETKSVYTPDFFIGDYIVEAKGKLTAKDRKKYAAFVAQYPEIKYRFIFMRDNKIHRLSKTRYSDWATGIGVPYCIGKFSAKRMKEFKRGKDT